MPAGVCWHCGGSHDTSDHKHDRKRIKEYMDARPCTCPTADDVVRAVRAVREALRGEWTLPPEYLIERAIRAAFAAGRK